MASQEINSHEIESILRKYLHEEVAPEEAYTKDQQPLEFHGLEDEDIDEVASRIIKLIDSKSNENIYFYNMTLDSEFGKLKSMLGKISPERAIAFVKAVKLLLALAMKGE